MVVDAINRERKGLSFDNSVSIQLKTLNPFFRRRRAERSANLKLKSIFFVVNSVGWSVVGGREIQVKASEASLNRLASTSSSEGSDLKRRYSNGLEKVKVSPPCF